MIAAYFPAASKQDKTLSVTIISRLSVYPADHQRGFSPSLQPLAWTYCWSISTKTFLSMCLQLLSYLNTNHCPSLLPWIGWERKRAFTAYETLWGTPYNEVKSPCHLAVSTTTRLVTLPWWIIKLTNASHWIICMLRNTHAENNR